MMETVQDTVKKLVLACKASSIRSMHRLASGWDTQGALPAMRLPEKGTGHRPRRPLQFGFSPRSRSRMGWTHFLARLGH